MAFLLALIAVVLICSALFFLLRRLLGRRTSPTGAGDDRSAAARRDGVASTGWTRQDRLAVASLVVGTLLGILALLKP